MSRMSEQHDDLSTIHAILLGQRQLANKKADQCAVQRINNTKWQYWLSRVEVIDDLLTEIEAAGVVWPGNVVEGDFSKCWPKEF